MLSSISGRARNSDVMTQFNSDIPCYLRSPSADFLCDWKVLTKSHYTNQNTLKRVCGYTQHTVLHLCAEWDAVSSHILCYALQDPHLMLTLCNLLFCHLSPLLASTLDKAMRPINASMLQENFCVWKQGKQRTRHIKPPIFFLPMTHFFA